MNRLTNLAVVGLALVSVQQSVQRHQIPTLTPEQQAILSHLSLVELPDGHGGVATTIRIEGVNVQIVNGAGATSVVNGLGNLIVGYNELGSPYGDDRRGSHCIAVGSRNNFKSYGGLVSGSDNEISGVFASVAGGRHNVASGGWSHVSGGGGAFPIGHPSREGNLASGGYSSIAGGVAGIASGVWAAVGGGNNNHATGDGASVSGGQNVNATAPSSWAGGGLDLTESNWWGTLVGGCTPTCP